MKKSTKRTYPLVFDACVLPGGALPQRARRDDVGYDVKTRALVGATMNPRDPRIRKALRRLDEPFVLQPGKTVRLGTGVGILIPRGYAGYVEPRDSTSNAEITVINANVPIDPGFTGESTALIRNDGKKPFPIHHHQRIVQFVFKPVALPTLRAVKALPKTARGNRSNGSTGK